MTTVRLSGLYAPISDVQFSTTGNGRLEIKRTACTIVAPGGLVGWTLVTNADGIACPSGV